MAAHRGDETMTPAELTDYLRTNIPLTAAMEVSAISVAPDAVVLEAPLAPNINHRKTVFGGSASALGILAAWSLVHLRLADTKLEHRLVIQRNTMSYDAPIEGTFTATAVVCRRDRLAEAARHARAARQGADRGGGGVERRRSSGGAARSRLRRAPRPLEARQVERPKAVSPEGAAAEAAVPEAALAWRGVARPPRDHRRTQRGSVCWQRSSACWPRRIASVAVVRRDNAESRGGCGQRENRCDGDEDTHSANVGARGPAAKSRPALRPAPRACCRWAIVAALRPSAEPRLNVGSRWRSGSKRPDFRGER